MKVAPVLKGGLRIDVESSMDWMVLSIINEFLKRPRSIPPGSEITHPSPFPAPAAPPPLPDHSDSAGPSGTSARGRANTRPSAAR